MKKKKVILIILCLAIFTGCSNVKKIENYPFSDGKSTSSDEGSNSNKDGDTLDYVVLNSSGTTAFEVKATKVEDKDETYPVYDVDPCKFSDDDLKKYCEKLFDKGSTNVILPIFLTQSDYVEKRIKDLTERKDAIETKEEEVPPYIDEELKVLNERSISENLGSNYTIPYNNEIGWINLNDFYENEMNEEIDCHFCYVEGTIDGEYYRADFLDNMNNTAISIYRQNAYSGEPDSYLTLKDTEHLPYDKNSCTLTEQDATNKSEEFLEKLGINGYEPIAVYPVCIYGEQKDYSGNYLADAQSGYTCYFAREVNGKTRPYNSFVDESTFIKPYANYLLSLSQYHEFGMYSHLEIGENSGVFRLGYEYLRVSITDRGIEECFFNSPSNVGDIKTDKAELLSFDKIDKRAQEYLQYYTNNIDDETHYSIPKIDLVQMGMCRVTDDDKHYYMVPAWYYYLSSDLLQVEKKSAVCINAIDGSIIDVESGGNTIEID